MNQPDIPQRLADGDESVLLDILLDYGPWAANTLRTLFGDGLSAEDIEDVLAEALMLVWLHRSRFDPAKAKLVTWFFGIAKNVAVNHLRLKKIVFSPLPKNLPARSEVSFATATDKTGPPKQDPWLQSLRLVFAELSDMEQEVAVAAANGHVDGLAPWTDSVSTALNITPNYARVIWHRIKRKIEKRMDQLGYSVCPQDKGRNL